MGSLNRKGFDKRKYVSKRRPKTNSRTCPKCGGTGKGDVKYGQITKCTRCGGARYIW